MRNAKLFLTLLTVTTGLSGCDDGSGYRAGYKAGMAMETGQYPGDAPVRRFTKAEFANYAYGKTKAQIRAEFGAPFAVDDSTAEWKYGPGLGVVDADAGTPTYVSIRFMGFGGPDDEVASVRYF